MLNVNIIAVGKLKEPFLRDACAEYVKRLGAFCKPKIFELAESRLSENPSEKEISAALSDEGKLILPIIKEKSCYNIAMCIEGRQFSSEEFSEIIGKNSVLGKSTFNFVIGSSFGLAGEVKDFCDLRLSMSKMTFPHQLARLMLLEQIYRGFQIIGNGKYHK